MNVVQRIPFQLQRHDGRWKSFLCNRPDSIIGNKSRDEFERKIKNALKLRANGQSNFNLQFLQLGQVSQSGW